MNTEKYLFALFILSLFIFHQNSFAQNTDAGSFVIPYSIDAQTYPANTSGDSNTADDAAYSNCYATYWPSGRRIVEFDICENSSGNSGFVRKRNLTQSPINVCWILEFRDGSESRRLCHTRLMPFNPNEQWRFQSGCFNCHRNNTGVSGMRIVSLEYSD
jgi:hypothetical protein